MDPNARASSQCFPRQIARHAWLRGASTRNRPKPAQCGQAGVVGASMAPRLRTLSGAGTGAGFLHSRQQPTLPAPVRIKPIQVINQMDDANSSVFEPKMSKRADAKYEARIWDRPPPEFAFLLAALSVRRPLPQVCAVVRRPRWLGSRPLPAETHRHEDHADWRAPQRRARAPLPPRNLRHAVEVFEGLPHSMRPAP